MRVLLTISFFFLACIYGCQQNNEDASSETEIGNSVKLVVLGTIQDAGSPQIGCQKDCCKDLYSNPDPDRMVVSLGLIDESSGQRFLFEATPDLPRQLQLLDTKMNSRSEKLIDGIFLTHAHTGHYTGLMYLGKESIDADSVPVYVMPKMKSFLEENGPWDQLVKRRNIKLWGINAENPVELTDKLKVIPLRVPHRDEYSETVGYKIIGPNKSALFIPDIDKWEKWDRDIIYEIEKVDFAFLDATFFSGEELGNRDMSEIPHPSIEESMNRFSNLPPQQKAKIFFIHFNHTNPVLRSSSTAVKTIENAGYQLARLGIEFNI